MTRPLQGPARARDNAACCHRSRERRPGAVDADDLAVMAGYDSICKVPGTLQARLIPGKGHPATLSLVEERRL
jgi:hypothetical protein